MTTVGWQSWWSSTPFLHGAEWCSGWVDYLKGVVWTEPRCPAPTVVRLVLLPVDPEDERIVDALVRKHAPKRTSRPIKEAP